MKLHDSILADAAGIAVIRRDIHAHPELGYQEERTSDLIAKQLSAWGIPVHRGLGGTGVVGTIHGRDGGACGRAIGIRADMDALPLQEINTFAHASQHAGKMHACGHDGHMAMALAAAQQLARTRDFDGTVHMIFQPAEEGGGGAKAMIDDGLFDKFPVEAVFGVHNWPGAPVGTFLASPGPVMASSNRFKIVVRGKGSHAAMPHMSIDPVPLAAQLIMAFQTIVTRNLKPIDTGVVSVTMVHTGEAPNVTPDACELQGTVRAFTDEVLDLIESRMRQITESLCASVGARHEFEFIRSYPPTVNTPYEAEFARKVMAGIVGESNVRPQEPTMVAEDFSFMLQARPGAYCFISNGDGSHREMGHGGGPCTLHNTSYDFNDELIPLGGTYWVELARQWLAREHTPPARPGA